LSDASLSAGEKKDSIYEPPKLRLEQEKHPVLEEVTTSIGVRLPPPSPKDELVLPRFSFWRRHRLFTATVVLPVAIVGYFLTFVASPRYGSTASFIVRSIDRSIAAQEAESSLANGLATTIASDETYAIVAYLQSRDVVDQLARFDSLREMLNRPQGDFVTRYPTFWLPDNKEFLYWRFQWMVSTNVDPETGIGTIEASAFTPEDAQGLIQAMLRHAEALVNRMNERYYQTQTASAERFVAQAEKRVEAVEAELKDFRNHTGSLDPNLVAKSELDVIQGLSAQLAQVEASIAQQVKLAPAAPSLAGLRAQARSYRDEIDKIRLSIAGGANSEAEKLHVYDQLTLRRDLAIQALSDAMAQLELARSDAERQHLYVQVITRPRLERDWARYPKVTFGLAALLAICLGVFLVLRKLRDIALEHRP